MAGHWGHASTELILYALERPDTARLEYDFLHVLFISALLLQHIDIACGEFVFVNVILLHVVHSETVIPLSRLLDVDLKRYNSAELLTRLRFYLVLGGLGIGYLALFM